MLHMPTATIWVKDINSHCLSLYTGYVTCFEPAYTEGRRSTMGDKHYSPLSIQHPADEGSC
jgi:hypothetical protein